MYKIHVQLSQVQQSITFKHQYMVIEESYFNKRNKQNKSSGSTLTAA